METPNGHTKHQMASPMSSISIGAVDDHSIVAGTTVQNSPRHDALFTYFSRIIRDIWHKSLCYVRGTTVILL